MKVLKICLSLINFITLLVLVTYVSVIIPTNTKMFYKYEYEKNKIEEVINIKMENLQIVTDHMLDYLNNKNDDLTVNTVVNNTVVSFFSDREIAHMKDVKYLFLTFELIRNISIGLFLSTGITMIFIDKSKLYLPKIYKYLSITTLVLLIMLVVTVSMNFNNAFEIFHQMFFDNDLYLLDPNVDLLINILPLRFFIDIAIIIASIFVTLMVILILISHFYIKKVIKGNNN